MAGMLYNSLWHNRKTREWSSDAGWLWTLCISFTHDHKTKGVLTQEDVAIVAATNRIPASAITELVEKRGLDARDQDYSIHDYGKVYKKAERISKERRTAGAKGLAKRRANGPAKALQAVLEGEGEVIKNVISKWRESIGRDLAATPGRCKVVLARLRDGYTEEELGDAARGWKNDPWPERVNHNDLTILLRSGEQVEKFRDLFRHGPPTVAAAEGKGTIAARLMLQEAAALRAG